MIEHNARHAESDEEGTKAQAYPLVEATECFRFHKDVFAKNSRFIVLRTGVDRQAFSCDGLIQNSSFVGAYSFGSTKKFVSPKEIYKPRFGLYNSSFGLCKPRLGLCNSKFGL